jgi:cytochrome c553
VHRSTILAALVLAATPVLAQGDPNLGRNIAATCANCHGTSGASVGGNEPLAGKPKAEIVQKMQDFKAGRKPATIMHQLAKGFTDAQIEAAAEYFAAQKPAR